MQLTRVVLHRDFDTGVSLHFGKSSLPFPLQPNKLTIENLHSVQGHPEEISPSHASRQYILKCHPGLQEKKISLPERRVGVIRLAGWRHPHQSKSILLWGEEQAPAGQDSSAADVDV